MSKTKVQIIWFRRDLRLEDHSLVEATQLSTIPIFPLFIFDQTILQQLDNPSDRRVDYIHQALTVMDKELKTLGGKMHVMHGCPIDVFKELSEKYDISTIHACEDYEPQAIVRDKEIYNWIKEIGGQMHLYKDQVIFSKSDILKQDGTPYTVFTPYSKRWKLKLQEEGLKIKSGFNIKSSFIQNDDYSIPSLESLGFEKTDLRFIKPEIDREIIKSYAIHRDFPSIEGTSRLGLALRFGTISVRKCVAFALQANETWLNELIWREFFMQILYHFPKVVNRCFRDKYEQIKWRNNEEEFQLWCEGKTGYPIVDAGMRELNATGFMHNRVRMIVASFLCKHLLIDWRWGEAYFASKLNDYDLAANNGNWQWAAGCGCDAAPYFRIFNPYTQAEKYDPHANYQQKWLRTDYNSVPPIINHDDARKRCLTTFKESLNN